MIYRYDEDMAPPRAQTDSTRLWVSDQQWLAILERVQRGQPALLSDGDCRRLHERSDYACRCMLRLGDGAGTFVVRTQDISAGGLRFIHGQPLRNGTRCTIVLQPDGAMGRILSAVVAWCSEIEYFDEDIEGYEIGVRFDEPVDVSLFVGAA
ncbi:PilZ domain-containing protein [Phycisphaeraceae bacterium D3-23]